MRFLIDLGRPTAGSAPAFIGIQTMVWNGAGRGRDFTLEKYSELLLALIGKYRIMTVADYLTRPEREHIAVLRHDVDKFPGRAVHRVAVG
ncbi:MAG: hypothetical protein Q7J68_03315 [Thermoplasmata archaeon]|nr:hypothetical protein [Thermoplasmata archaeon]